MIYVLVVIILMIIVFWVIISHFGTSSSNNNVDEDISTVNYVSKQFLSKFIDLENELHVNIVPQVNLASIIQKVSKW